MTRYICNQCQQSYASPQSLWNHKKRCQNKRQSNLDAKLTGRHRYSTQRKNLRKGGNLSSDETLRKIMEMLKGKMVDSEVGCTIFPTFFDDFVALFYFVYKE